MCRILAIFLCCLVNLTLADQCNKVGDCSCEFYDGKGINLAPVIPKTNQPLQTIAPNADEYYFSPCETIKYVPNDQPNRTDPEGGCSNGYTLCMFVNETKTYKRLGELQETQFSTKEDENVVYMTYKHPKESAVTHVKLLCTNDKKSYLFLEPTAANNAGNETLLLFSPYACPITIEDFSKPSTGTVLLIMLFISFLSYFLIGATVNAFYLGARGMEIIPNLDFWRSLPGLVRDGASFLQNGCRVERRAPNPDSYDAI
ncbi:uncharacterized protein LOC128273375 [Anopheles cruzii]|uniref:uncharacterized protein LOC128273375 n=1 Tax=Anopheles cruzii TaxID=68878 RepID=UPI0022EC2FCC|nr:uncharacterized protein LOC128273375 [Anopheles cruzii]